MLCFLRDLQDKLLEAPPLVPEVTEQFLEDFSNDEHVRLDTGYQPGVQSQQGRHANDDWR
jgi:hypothetical protein